MGSIFKLIEAVRKFPCLKYLQANRSSEDVSLLMGSVFKLIEAVRKLSWLWEVSSS